MTNKNKDESKELTERECKQRWNASLPYPLWPFGEVPRKELEIYAQTLRKQEREEVGEALM